MKRVRAIDYAKGIAVAAMVLCHVMQFFGKPGVYGEQGWIMTAINALAFPMFLFAYGQSVALAYGERPYREAAPRMALSALRGYGAFCLSGIAYLVLCEQKDLSSRTVLRVVALRSIPGWSEFLITFALFGLVALALIKPLMKLVQRDLAFWLVCAACLAGVCVPYGAVRDPRWGLLVGTTEFACFPVLQYMPFFLIGLYVQRRGMARRGAWLAGSALLTGAAVISFVRAGEPVRFPPSLMWLLLPCLPIVLLTLGCGALERHAGGRRGLEGLLAPVGFMGMNSLFYLLASNFVIFAVSRMGTLPVMRRSERFPFCLETGSTPWALVWTLVLLLGIGFMIGLARKPRKKAQ